MCSASLSVRRRKLWLLIVPKINKLEKLQADDCRARELERGLLRLLNRKKNVLGSVDREIK